MTITLGFIGAGKVGATLARLWSRSGYTITAIYSRTPDHATKLAEQVGALAVMSPREVVVRADLTFLTVPDDLIAPLAAALVPESGNLHGKGIVHTSGARGREVLNVLSEHGAMTGGLHPAFPFADVETAVAGLPGASFAVETVDEHLQDWLVELVGALNGRVVVIPPGGKVTYHLALAIASNYAVTLYAVAEQLLLSLGTDRAVADNALNALLAGTVHNLRTQGIPKSMVGPLTREDVGTISAHLAVLGKSEGTLAEVYRGLARLSYPMLKARGISTDSIERLLRQDENHETDHS